MASELRQSEEQLQQQLGAVTADLQLARQELEAALDRASDLSIALYEAQHATHVPMLADAEQAVPARPSVCSPLHALPLAPTVSASEYANSTARLGLDLLFRQVVAACQLGLNAVQNRRQR